MAREVGGSDLTQVLRSLAVWLRQDAAIRQEVEARQSWVLNAAKLGVAAPWIILLLLASRPEAAMAYNSASGTRRHRERTRRVGGGLPGDDRAGKAA